MSFVPNMVSRGLCTKTEYESLICYLFTQTIYIYFSLPDQKVALFLCASWERTGDANWPTEITGVWRHSFLFLESNIWVWKCLFMLVSKYKCITHSQMLSHSHTHTRTLTHTHKYTHTKHIYTCALKNTHTHTLPHSWLCVCVFVWAISLHVQHGLMFVRQVTVELLCSLIKNALFHISFNMYFLCKCVKFSLYCL